MPEEFPDIDVAANDVTKNIAKRDALRDEAVGFIREACAVQPIAAIILGSGLGGLADQIHDAISIAYHDIPGFAKSTAGGHRGELILGTLGDAPVVAMAGRFHRYEGWSIDDVAFPVHVMNALGASRLIVSNAAGGVNPKLRVGDIVVITDHINLMTGISLCSRYPANLSIGRAPEVYDPAMSAIAMETSIQEQFTAYRGTYLATFGPTYETRAEYRMQRKIGADVAGMSTVPEVLAAIELQMSILGLSLVTNVANPDISVKADHADVLQAGQAGATKMESIVRRVLDDALRV